MSELKISELANTAECQVQTIRYYEREGLLPAPVRSAGNYRLYNEAHVERLRFIRHCRSLDMTLENVRLLLMFKDAPDKNCRAVDTLLDEHIGHVASRIKQLELLQTQLKSLRSQCKSAKKAKDCQILQKLSNGKVH